GRQRSEPATAFATSTLIPSASGHVRSLPVTSGRRIFHRVSQEGPFSSQESAMIDTPNGPFPFGEHDVENRHNLLAKLPPTEYCNQLKDLYLKSIAPPYVSRTASLAWLALLFTILGTAVLTLENDSPLLGTLSRKPTPWDRVTELSERYYTAAMKCLEADRYLCHGQTWTLLGLVYHLALSIGCHVDPATFSLDIVEAGIRFENHASFRYPRRSVTPV
ncbi:hypothetical protein N7537_002535, partial [Penicillium hordei]